MSKRRQAGVGGLPYHRLCGGQREGGRGIEMERDRREKRESGELERVEMGKRGGGEREGGRVLGGESGRERGESVS